MKCSFLVTLILVLLVLIVAGCVPSSPPTVTQTAVPTTVSMTTATEAPKTSPPIFTETPRTPPNPPTTKPPTTPSTKPPETSRQAPKVTAMPRGTKEPNLSVDVYQPDKVSPGTTFLTLNYDLQTRKIVEINMLGEVVWEYDLTGVPATSFVEAELLPNSNILYTIGEKGVYEIDRSGKLIWSYLTNKIDHDADRLPNGDTIFVFGMGDQKSDAQVTEVNQKGEVVWQWFARDSLDKSPYASIFAEGWTHANAVTRLSTGNTFISLRNFNMVVEVDPKGKVLRNIGEGILKGIHDPDILPNGNILGALPLVMNPVQAVEVDSDSGAIVWQFSWPRELLPQGTRDANRLPNGNTLITGSMAIVEVTSIGEIVWQISLKASVSQADVKSRGFYKSDRISEQK
jgi:hypothetical protein